MGRTKIFKDGKEEIGVYLSPDEAKAFDEIRWRERKGRTELGRQAILDYIKSHSEGNDTFKLDKWNEDPDFQALPTFLSNTEKWIACYKNSNEKDRTKLRIQANHLAKLFPNIDFNENRR